MTISPGGAGAAAERARPKTLAEQLRMQLSDDIVRGELAPGIALDEAEPRRPRRLQRLLPAGDHM